VTFGAPAGRVLLASRNAKKLAELRRILGEHVTVLGLDDVPAFPEEQAAAVTGEVALADDSGLAVDELNGMPGVLSARWSGRHGDDAANNALLLAQVADVPDERRGAEFVCALALAVPGSEPFVVHGRWRGRLLRAPRGTNGFGYDPLFVPTESDEAGDGRSSAELSPAEKDAQSHRGRALRAMLPRLREALGSAG
jgi:XTP/dITP diphosphohydrolase